MQCSLYLSVPQGDTRSLDDIVDRPDPELTYLHSILVHNITIVNYHGGNKTMLVFHVHQVILSDVKFENNIGQDLMVVIVSEISFSGQCIFKNNIGGIAAYLHTQLVFTEDSNVQILDMHDDYNTPLRVSYSYMEVQRNSTIIFKNNSGVLSGAMAVTGALCSFADTGITMLFVNNRGISGGALAFYDKGRFQFENSEVQITLTTNNYASKWEGQFLSKMWNTW